MIPHIEKSVTVPLSVDQAFDLFTGDIAKWWPGETHSLSASTGERPVDIEVDPRLGGKITETCADGTRKPWATITAWEPGARLSLDWYVGRDPREATQIDVQFVAVAIGTRVDLTHSGFDRLAGGQTVAMGYQTGWDSVLGTCFGGYCLKRAA